MTSEDRDDEIVFILDCDTEVVFIPLIPEPGAEQCGAIFGTPEGREGPHDDETEPEVSGGHPPAR